MCNQMCEDYDKLFTLQRISLNILFLYQHVYTLMHSQNFKEKKHMFERCLARFQLNLFSSY